MCCIVPNIFLALFYQTEKRTFLKQADPEVEFKTY